MNKQEIQILRTISVSYKGFKADGSGPYVTFKDAYVSEGERVKTKVIYMDNNTDERMDEFAMRKLAETGFNVVSRSSLRDEYLFHCNNWGDNFKEIADIKK